MVGVGKFGSALLAPGASGIVQSANGFGTFARVVFSVWILLGVLFLFICFELRAFVIASFRRLGIIGGIPLPLVSSHRI